MLSSKDMVLEMQHLVINDNLECYLYRHQRSQTCSGSIFSRPNARKQLLPVLCVFIHVDLKRTPARTQKYVWRNTRAYARARVRLFVCSHFNKGWKDVDTCVLVEERRAVPYSRSSLPGELEFLAVDRILSRESRDARLATIYATSWASRCAGALYIHNVIHQNVVMRLIVYRRPSESSGMYFPKRNGNANDLFAPLRYIVIDAGHHRIDVTNVGGCSDH